MLVIYSALHISDIRYHQLWEKVSFTIIWKKRLKFGKTLHSSLKRKSPCHVMTLIGEAKEAVLNVGINELKDKNEVVNLIALLDQMYFRDESAQAYEAYETFEKFVRPYNMTTADYVIKLCYKSFKVEILHGALAYRLSNSANLSREQKQLVRATVSKMDNNITKDQLRKVFTNNAGDLLQKNYLSEEKIKV